MPRTRPVRFALTFCALLVLATACENLQTGGQQPMTAWNQDLVTHLAGQLASQMADLYTSAEKEPAFAGERSAYGETLGNLRVLREESAGLHQQLSDGKGYEQTRTRFERIQEVARDTQESESWALLPEDFTGQAERGFTVLGQLDAYFGAH